MTKMFLKSAFLKGKVVRAAAYRANIPLVQISIKSVVILYSQTMVIVQGHK